MNDYHYEKMEANQEDLNKIARLKSMEDTDKDKKPSKIINKIAEQMKRTFEQSKMNPKDKLKYLMEEERKKSQERQSLTEQKQIEIDIKLQDELQRLKQEHSLSIQKSPLRGKVTKNLNEERSTSLLENKMKVNKNSKHGMKAQKSDATIGLTHCSHEKSSSMDVHGTNHYKPLKQTVFYSYKKPLGSFENKHTCQSQAMEFFKNRLNEINTSGNTYAGKGHNTAVKSPVFSQLSVNYGKTDYVPSENSKSPKNSNCTGGYQNNISRNVLRKNLSSTKLPRSRRFDDDTGLKKYASQDDDLKIKGNLDNKQSNKNELDFQENLANAINKKYHKRSQTDRFDIKGINNLQIANAKCNEDIITSLRNSFADINFNTFYINYDLIKVLDVYYSQEDKDNFFKEVDEKKVQEMVSKFEDEREKIHEILARINGFLHKSCRHFPNIGNNNSIKNHFAFHRYASRSNSAYKSPTGSDKKHVAYSIKKSSEKRKKLFSANSSQEHFPTKKNKNLLTNETLGSQLAEEMQSKKFGNFINDANNNSYTMESIDGRMNNNLFNKNYFVTPKVGGYSNLANKSISSKPMAPSFKAFKTHSFDGNLPTKNHFRSQFDTEFEKIEENAVMEHNADDRSDNYDLFKEDNIIEHSNSIESGEIIFMDTSTIQPQQSGYLLSNNLHNKEETLVGVQNPNQTYHKSSAKLNRMNDIVANHGIKSVEFDIDKKKF